MLLLTVEQKDKVFIGEGQDAIVVEYKKRSGDKVQLGINAPREIPINTIFNDSSKQFKNRKTGKEPEDTFKERVGGLPKAIFEQVIKSLIIDNYIDDWEDSRVHSIRRALDKDTGKNWTGFLMQYTPDVDDETMEETFGAYIYYLSSAVVQVMKEGYGA